MSSRHGAAMTCTPIGSLPSAELPQRTTVTGHPVLLNTPVYCHPVPGAPNPGVLGSASIGCAGFAATGQRSTSYFVIHASMRDLHASCASHAATYSAVE